MIKKQEPDYEMRVLKTTDYHLFSLIFGNRDVDVAHVKRLENSFTKRQLISLVIVNEHHQIIDGQHRFRVCEKLGLPIYYIVVPGYGLDEVQILNTNASNWKKIDYLNHYCDSGRAEYLKFREFMRTYPDFGFQACEMLLAHKTISRTRLQDKELITDSNKNGHVYFRTFEDGEFVCVNYSDSCEIADKILRIKQYNQAVVNRKAFVATMIQLFKNEMYDHDEFMQKLAHQPTALTTCVNVTQYKSLIEDIYNWKRKNKINLRH